MTSEAASATSSKINKEISKEINEKINYHRSAWERLYRASKKSKQAAKKNNENRKETKPPPYDALYSKLKRAVYRLAIDYQTNDLIAVLKESVRTQADNKTKIKPSAANDANPFYWALTAVCQADCELPRSTKSRFAQELKYADMHNVPPEFLVGFIYQIGSSRGLQENIDKKEMQSWYQKRLAKAAKEA